MVKASKHRGWDLDCLLIERILAHLIQLFSAGATTIVISSTGIELLLGLLLYHVTRKLYRRGRQLNIASSSGKDLDDHEVRNLADNQDLAVATTWRQ